MICSRKLCTKKAVVRSPTVRFHYAGADVRKDRPGGPVPSLAAEVQFDGVASCAKHRRGMEDRLMGHQALHRWKAMGHIDQARRDIQWVHLLNAGVDAATAA